MSSQMKYMHKKYREKMALKRLSDPLWYLMVFSDTLRTGYEKGRVVVIKSRNV